MIRTFKYRLSPNRKQRETLKRTLDSCRELYNIMLEQRRYQRIGKFEQMREVTQLRGAFPEYASIAAYVTEDVAKRVDRSFQNFFRRGGFPRFKSESRYDSFTYRGCFKLSGNYLQLLRIGNIKLRLSRAIPSENVIKTCTIRRSGGRWYACLAFECAPCPLPATGNSVGIDVGLNNFAALSDGSFIANPRIYERAQAEIRKAQRRVARRSKGSNRRRMAIELLRAIHEKLANRRQDFLHKQSTAIIRNYDVVAVEDLNVKGLAAGSLAKQVRDASWSMFHRFLAYKAEGAERELVAVDPRGTSQTCPTCGAVKKKTLSERIHRCDCGCTLDRDTAAAMIILARAAPSSVNLADVVA